MAGPTGGYLVGFVFLTVIADFVSILKENCHFVVLGMVLEQAYVIFFGNLAFMQLNIGFVAGLGVRCFAYSGNLVKIAI